MTGIHLALATTLLLAAACGPRSAAPRGDRNFISTEELRASTQPNLYTAVESLRPLWLRSRGPTSITQGQQTVRVYLDGTLMGGPEQLRQIPTQSVSSLRFVDGPQATQRWGLDHGMGAIVIATRGEARS